MKRRISVKIWIGLVLVFVLAIVIYRNNKKSESIAVINFQFDDGNENDFQIVDMFERYGLKCGFSLVSTISNSIRLHEYQKWYLDGYDVLAHSTDGVPMAEKILNKEEIRLKIIKSKYILEASGFEIHGWVTPSSKLNNSYKNILKQGFDYGYTEYYGHYDEACEKRPYNTKYDNVYNLYRIDLYNEYEDIILAIDTTIKNKGFLTFYYHSADLTEEDTNKICSVLEYITEKMDEDLCLCLAPNKAFEYYFN